MGLFGSSPQKKLEKAREHFAAGRWFEAMRLFEEVIEAGGKVAKANAPRPARAPATAESG